MNPCLAGIIDAIRRHAGRRCETHQRGEIGCWQVKRTIHTDGNADDSVMLVSRPTQKLHRLPGVGLFYDNSIHGVPHPLVALVSNIAVILTFGPAHKLHISEDGDFVQQ